MTDRWRAALLSGLAEGGKLAEVQHLDPGDERLLQEERIARRVEELVAELPGESSLVEARPAGTYPASLVVEARSGGVRHRQGPPA